MTRRELILNILQRARTQGFHLRPWYQKTIEPEWKGLDHALDTLEHGHRYYALLFSHEFASHFWKKGTQITFQLPSHEYNRLDRNGNLITVQRKPFTRRTSRSNSNKVWQYHIEQMSLWEEPLRYIRRFILNDEPTGNASGNSAPEPPAKTRGLMRRRIDWC